MNTAIGMMPSEVQDTHTYTHAYLSISTACCYKITRLTAVFENHLVVVSEEGSVSFRFFLLSQIPHVICPRLDCILHLYYLPKHTLE